MATRDLLTLEEAKPYVGIDVGDSTQNDMLAVYVTAASQLLDEWVGPTVALSVSGEVHDGQKLTAAWRRKAVVLNHRPVITIGTVTEYNGTSPSVLTAETPGVDGDYRAGRYDPDPALLSGILHLTTSTWINDWVVISYTAGRVSSTTSVQPRFKQACGIVLENLWRDRQIGTVQFDEYDIPKASFPGFAMPNAARQLLIREYGQHEPYGIA